nr:zinc-dependent alcohol dehydrogenase family protein [Nakamurella flavida]
MSVREIPDPVCPDDGAVIEVRATGVCRSDWHAWRGHDPVSLPHVPGHELAGILVELGSGVGDLGPGRRLGDTVTVPFVLGCGRCALCRAGEAQVCPDQTQPGFTGPGSFAERVVVRPAAFNLVAVPDGVDVLAAAALGCRFATAWRALTVHGRVAPGQWVAVFGCGGLGLSAVMIAVALGARVVAVDTSADALDRARELGAEQVVAAGPDTAERIREITAGGAHVGLDAVGSTPTAVGSVLSLRRRGRHVQAGLLLGAGSTPPLPMDRVIAHELEIYGSHGMPAVDYPGMLELVAAGRLRPQDLIGQVVGLNGAGPALAALDGPAAPGITVVDPRS